MDIRSGNNLTIFSELVKLRITPKQTWQLKSFNQGINHIWHNYDYYKNEVVCQFLGSDHNPRMPIFRETIEDELNKIGKIICQDGVKKQKETPLKLGTTEVILDHPAYRKGERDALRKHFKNVHEIKVPIPTIKEINKIYENIYGEGTAIEDIKGVDHENNEVIIESGDIEDGTDIRNI